MTPLYDLILIFSLLFIFPGCWWKSWRTGKKYPSLKQRLGVHIPNSGGKPVIWIHAVSVGEVKAAQPLFIRLRKLYPNVFFLITTASATGQEEAKRSLSEADAFAFLPLDLSFVMARWVRKLRPQSVFFVEGDLWYQLAKQAKARGAKVSLVSGKVSEKSAKRFAFFQIFSRRLFSLFDLILVQNEQHLSRFQSFCPHPIVGGNLKLDLEPKQVDLQALHKIWGTGPWITVSCTHDPEEALLLSHLKPFLNRSRIFLAPRHPERSDKVADLLRSFEIPFCRIDYPDEAAKVVLVDQLGKLSSCYSLSQAAIVGGSYTEKVGGHNVLEPCLYGCPSFFGPHMHGQKELAQLIQFHKAGGELPLDQLSRLWDPGYREGVKKAIASINGSLERTLKYLLDGSILPPNLAMNPQLHP